MPKKIEKKLKAGAKKKGFKGKRANAYVYGTMNKMGMMPKKERSGMNKMSVAIHKGEKYA